MSEQISNIDKIFWEIAINDNEQAFKSLFFDYFPSLCVFAHRYVDSWDTCEDLVQDSFLKIWENRKKININSSFKNFLITTVRNHCLDYLRREQLEINMKEARLQKEDTESLADLYSVVELNEILTKALEKLPENIRIVFEMNRFDGKKYAEIAAENNISVKTVESYISKALKLLRLELKDYLIDIPCWVSLFICVY